MRTKKMQQFIDRYIECALWSSVGGGGDPLDQYELSDDARAKLSSMAERFALENADLIAQAMCNREVDYLGYDLWLAQNGHDAGFWDRDELDKRGAIMNNTKKAINNILKKAGYSFEAINLGLGSMNEADERGMNKWRAVFTDKDIKHGATFDYYTGIGLQHLGNPVPPCAADVLYCLLNGRSAVGETFEQWAGNYGYDTDSRAAERIYNACIVNANKLDTIFNGGQQEELAALLEDY